jgi:hypothetical protein
MNIFATGSELDGIGKKIRQSLLKSNRIASQNTRDLQRKSDKKNSNQKAREVQSQKSDKPRNFGSKAKR